ncbi:MAG: pilin [Acidiferrobacterales bacterium]
MQKGFTLIELMIVVAIIGILAAIAVPAYQDYTIKSKVSEAASLAGAARTAIDVSYSEGFTVGGANIPSQANLGLMNAGSYTGKYVSSVATSTAGLVTVTLKSSTTLGLRDAAGTTVIYTPTARGGNLEWGVSGTVPQKYRPKT